MTKINRRARVRRNAKGRVGDADWTLIHDWFKHETRDKQEIADRLRVSRGAVVYALQHSEPPSRRKRNDPPPLQKSEAKKMLKRRALVLHLAKMEATDGRTRRKFPSCTLIAQEIRRHVGYDRCHRATVYRDLLLMGGVNLERPRTSTEKGKADPVQRFICCEYFLDHVDIDWMLFSDEVYFDDNDHGIRTQWCFDGERPMPRTETQFCTTAHFWLRPVPCSERAGTTEHPHPYFCPAVLRGNDFHERSHRPAVGCQYTPGLRARTGRTPFWPGSRLSREVIAPEGYRPHPRYHRPFEG